MLARVVDAFVQSNVQAVQVVIGQNQRNLYDSAVAPHPKLQPPVTGGATRQESVLAGLRGLGDLKPSDVLVQDGARPFASGELIGRVLNELRSADAVLPVTPISSTLKRVENGAVTTTISRDGLFAAETPQGFRFDLILDAHERAAAAGMTFTDDAAVAEWAGATVRTVPGEAGNIKLTTAEGNRRRRPAPDRRGRAGAGRCPRWRRVRRPRLRSRQRRDARRRLRSRIRAASSGIPTPTSSCTR